MQLTVAVGSTSKRIPVFIRDARDTAGNGLTGLVFNSAGLTWTYWREDEGNAAGTAVTLATATRGSFTSGGFIEKDSSLLPGYYELGIPNAALATGAGWVRMELTGAEGMVPLEVLLELVVVGTTINETIALGVAAHVGISAIASTVGAFALGVGAGAAPVPAGAAAVDSIEVDSTVGASFAAGLMDHQSLPPAVLVGVTPAPQVSARAAIALGVGARAQFSDQVTFGQVRRGKTSVAVTAKSTGKATVR